MQYKCISLSDNGLWPYKVGPRRPYSMAPPTGRSGPLVGVGGRSAEIKTDFIAQSMISVCLFVFSPFASGNLSSRWLIFSNGRDRL